MPPHAPPQATLIPPADDAPGRTLHREPLAPAGAAPDPGPPQAGYIRKSTLGQGGVGIVHLAVQRALGRPVALKSVRPDADRPAVRRSLLQEAHAAAAVEHPNIVPVYDLTHGPAGPEVVMRRIEGAVWTDYLVDPDRIVRDFGARDALDWHIGVLSQVCNAIHFAHSRGILHRDLKPDNVMIGPFGEVYVLDWGLAVRLHEGGPAAVPLAATDHRLVGTPRFMPPEMAAADGRRLSAQTDIYLLCGLLFTVLNRRPPHGGHTVEETLQRIPHFQPAVPPGTPQRLRRLVETGMSPDPAARPATAEKVRLGLQAFREERGADAMAEDAGRQLLALGEALAARPVDREVVYRRFGAARFGFRQALQRRTDHPEAREGLRMALVEVARFELSQGELAAAAVHLAELEDPPEDLIQARAAALAGRDAAAARDAKDRVERDPTVGQRTRIFVVAVVGAAWIGLPLAGWLGGVSLTRTALVGGHVALLVAVLGLVAWARDSLSRTRLNRTVASSLVVIQLVSLLSDLGFALAGTPADRIFAINLLVYSAISAMAATSITRMLAAPAVAYALAFIGSTLWPALVFPLTAMANASVVAVTLGLWLPAARDTLFQRRWEQE